MSTVKDYLEIQRYVPLNEDKDDVKEFTISLNKKGRQCVLRGCGAKSGTLGIIPHYYSCPKYFVPPPEQISTSDNTTLHYLKPEWYDCRKINVCQRKYHNEKYYDEDVIIGSFGAGPCLILAMRNRETKEVTMAHIDANTRYPLYPFKHYDSEITDVYLVGGDISHTSVEMINNIMIKIKDYTVKIIHILDNYFANSLYILNTTGEFAINCDRSTITRFFPLDEFQKGITQLTQQIGEKTYYL